MPQSRDTALPKHRMAHCSGADPGGFLSGFDLIILPYLLYVFGQTGLTKQWRPRSDAAKHGV